MDETLFQCSLKGILKKEGTDVLTGDCVALDNPDYGNKTARIVQVLPRTNQLARPKIANIDKVIVVASLKNPPLDLQQLDRYITQVQLAGLQSILCISKVDLMKNAEELEQIKQIYEPLGIPIYFTSVKDPESVKRLFEDVQGKTVVLAGLSGAGKSSLLNTYRPGLRLAVAEVSDRARRGRHTTREVSLIPINPDTFVADTPGFSYLKFDTVSPRSVEAAFPDFAPYREQCRYDDCLHLDEAGCAVREHLPDIAPSRYESYRHFQEEAGRYQEEVLSTSQKQEYGYKTLTKGKKQDLQVLKLPEKQREASRRARKQQIADWILEDATLEE